MWAGDEGVSLRDAVVWALVVLQVVLLWATFGWEALGTSPWHHVWSLAVVLAIAALLWRPMVTSRRFLALGILTSSLLATASGFWLLYWKEGIRVDGYQDWGVFWHIAWSWFSLVFFVMHTWINRIAFVHFFRRSLRRAGPAAAHLGGYALVLVAFFVTWSATGRAWFDSTNYIELSLYAWLVAVVPAYGVWLAARLRSGASSLGRRLSHWRVRSGVDLALVPIMVLTIASGVVLAFLDDWTDARGWKYVSKYWHVWPSVAFSVLVFVHAVQAWKTVRAHWRSYEVRPGRAATEPSRALATGRAARSR